MWPVI